MVGYSTAEIIRVTSLREQPELLPTMITFFQAHWGTPESNPVYADCLAHSVHPHTALPQWYLALTPNHQAVGGAGLIPNDFISRMDLFPWLCALFVLPEFRRQGVAQQLIHRASQDAQQAGFDHLYAATDLTDFYERQEFHYIGDGYQPWGDQLRIYERPLTTRAE